VASESRNGRRKLRDIFDNKDIFAGVSMTRFSAPNRNEEARAFSSGRSRNTRGSHRATIRLRGFRETGSGNVRLFARGSPPRFPSRAVIFGI